MPVTKSVKKAARSAQRKQLRNKSVRSAVKTYRTKCKQLIAAGELESAQLAVAKAIGAIDKAAGKGVIHSNKAARLKSRLMKKLNVALSSGGIETGKPEVQD